MHCILALHALPVYVYELVFASVRVRVCQSSTVSQAKVVPAGHRSQYVHLCLQYVAVCVCVCVHVCGHALFRSAGSMCLRVYTCECVCVCVCVCLNWPYRAYRQVRVCVCVCV